MAFVPERWGSGKWGQAHWGGQVGIDAEPGTATLAGQPLALLKTGSRVLLAGTGMATVSGRATELVYTERDYRAEAGWLSLRGGSAALRVTRIPRAVFHMGRRQRYLLGPWVSR